MACFVRHTINLLKAVHKFETQSLDTKSIESGRFLGTYFKMAIVPVGMSHKLATSGVERHLNYIEDQIMNGIEHFYIVSAGNTRYSKDLVDKATNYLGLSLMFEDEYRGEFRGRSRELYCAFCKTND